MADPTTSIVHLQKWITQNRKDLLPPAGDLSGQELVALGAARLGTTRLIDNLEF